MNIGIFSDTYYPQLNGVATSIRTLAMGLEKKGHNVYIFTPWDPRTPETDETNVFRIPSMPFLFLKNYRAGLLCPPHLSKKISSLNLDIIHTQTEFSLGFLGKFISTTQGIPLVHTYHTMYEDYVHYIARGHLISPEMAREFSKFFCNATTDVIAPTKKTEDLLLSYGVTTPISIIPTGIDTSNFSRDKFTPEEVLALRHSLGIDANTPVVLSIGRVAKEKSIDVVMKAMPALLENLPDAKMVIVGEGPERVNLEALAKSLGIENHVVFTGGKPWTEIGKYYKLGNVFCSASVTETQGLTFAEAMSAGIPVVAKNDPCINNIITHNETGLLFDETEELPALLYQIITDQALQTRLIKAGIETIKELSAENFCNRVEALYEKILESGIKPEKLSPPIIPLVIGVRAAKKITRFPKKLVENKFHYSHQLAKLLPYINKNK
ncbi:alpha-monoglucosyldiacylglycerol synthase [Anaerotignum neopropionicum]|uniref:Alpha-monoglucosyldiacylglycerol synthase n=1 Tax=Anaerotignum neopropionicum TaxID=36847 RepID=A0A136WBN1_9FIRM|nr:glycosyltransferase family 4 protein [Anaerotignum neopropionicum]KXL51900.1 alpha-monoglucosyldiacylglycerol synthase [Anaerotignum neopropionicum]